MFVHSSWFDHLRCPRNSRRAGGPICVFCRLTGFPVFMRGMHKFVVGVIGASYPSANARLLEISQPKNAKLGTSWIVGRSKSRLRKDVEERKSHSGVKLSTVHRKSRIIGAEQFLDFMSIQLSVVSFSCPIFFRTYFFIYYSQDT